MPRRLPSVIPLLIIAVAVWLIPIAQDSVVAELPPDVPDATLALDGFNDKKFTLTAGGEPLSDLHKSVADDLSISSPARLPDIAPITLSQMEITPSADMIVEEEIVAEETMPPNMMQPYCPASTVPRPVGPLRAIWHLPTRLFDYVFNPPQRHRDIGGPLTRQSWRYRPFGLGLFVGYINGGTLINDWLGSTDGTLGGFRLGWDPGYYWGCEFRYAASSMGTWDSLLAQETLTSSGGTYGLHRDVDLTLWDFSVLYYPWGDTTWRPYALAGLGSARMSFEDCMSEQWSQQVFAMPLALGLKYRYNSRLAFRFEAADNIVFATGQADTVHHFSFTGGLEIRFGGQSQGILALESRAILLVNGNRRTKNGYTNSASTACGITPDS